MEYPKENTRFNKEDKRTSVTITPILDVESEYIESFAEYAGNFREAAGLIADAVYGSNDISQLDSQFFSIAFLYRHSLELLLKASIFKYVRSTEDRIRVIKDSFHNLSMLLEQLELFVSTLISNSDGYIEEYVWLKAYLKDFSVFDKESDSFRYPFHIVRCKNIFGENEYEVRRVFQKQTHINLYKFIVKFEVAYDIIQNIYMDKKPETFQTQDILGDGCTKFSELSTVFLETGGTYYGQSVVGYEYHHEDHYPYIKAYLDTGKALRKKMDEELKNGNKEWVNRLYFPMMYTYRNGVELSLKRIWFQDIDVPIQEKCKKIIKRKHSIEGIWHLIKPETEKLAQNEEQKDYLKVIEAYCNAIQSYDTSASKFRYPCDKKMKPHFNKKLRLDYSSMGIYLESLIHFFDGVDAGLDEIRQYEAEMRAEYSDCY